MRIFLPILFCLLLSCGGDGPESPPAGQRTPQGVRVASVQPLNAAQLSAIDAGISRAIYAAKASGYADLPKHNVFTVRVRDCVPYNGTWAFQLRADNYDGTRFDIEPTPGVGVIYAAEQVISFDGDIAACPDIGVIGNAAQYGAEHVIIYHNDQEYYQQTETHGPPHPLLPKR